MARGVGAIAETVAFRVVLVADTFAAEGRSLFCLLTTSENHPFISFFQGKTWIDILVLITCLLDKSSAGLFSCPGICLLGEVRVLGETSMKQRGRVT
jgi:hypothetical protein